ncbi:Zinc finger BED domain-containing protein RICESLEEPER 2 [Glycine soja]
MRCQARQWIVAARAYLLHLVGCTPFANKSATYVHVVHLDAFRDLGQSGGYAWGVAALVHMYDQLDEASRTTTRQIAGYLTLLQCWIYEHFPSVHQCVTDDTYQETRHGSGTRPRENRIEPAPTLTDKNRVDRVRGRVRVFPDNPKRGWGQGRVWDYRYPPRPRPDPDPPQSTAALSLSVKEKWRTKVMEDISFSPKGIYPISSPINESPSPSPSPIDQTRSPIQVDLAPSPSPVNVDHTPSPYEDEVNNVEARGGICRLKSKIWQHFKKIKVNGLDKAECKYCKKLLGGKSKNGTKHLWQHNEICVQYKIFMRGMKGQTFLTPKVVQGKQELGAGTYDAERAREELAKEIIMHEFIYVPAPHTSDRLCNVLTDCLMDWNIDTKLSTITLDNCTTNDAMIDKIKDKLHLGSLLRDGSLLHMRCCAHILNLIVKDGLEVVKEGVENIRDSVAYWTTTPKRKEKFEETAKQLRLPYTKNLALDCPTRWNSTYKMLEIAIGYEDVLCRLKQRESQYTCLPSTLQWQFAKDICGRLKLFNTITELFSSTKHPTANLYFPNICEIKLAIKQWITSPNPMIQQMAKNMMIKFDKYWGVIHNVMGVATVLDPRYKMELLEYYYEKLYEHDSFTQVRGIQQLCYDLVSDYQMKMNKGSFGSNVGDVTGSEVVGDALSEYDRFIIRKKRARSSYVKSELDHYLEEDVLPRAVDFDILMWWKFNGVKYPTLQAIAKDILAIPVSTVASESAFSTGGQVLSPHRSRLQWTTLEALMCARSWLWSAENTGSTSYKVVAKCANVMNEMVSDDEGEMMGAASVTNLEE